MRTFFTAAVITILVACPLTASARASTQDHCDEKQDQWFHQADPKTWGGLYRLFKRFGQCDDGAIGEGFSEDVAQLFLKQWTHLDVLSHLMASDKSFKKFVLRHIDATLDEDELKAIADNSKSHCPTGEAQLCRSIGIEAHRSLEELRKYLTQCLINAVTGKVSTRTKMSGYPCIRSSALSMRL